MQGAGMHGGLVRPPPAARPTLAVERRLEIVGEALNRLPEVAPEIAAGIPDLRRAMAFGTSWPVGARRSTTPGLAVPQR
jgi:hypothetical protein